MNSQLFYKNLEAFDNFQDILNTEHYQDIPDDWYVVISDIKGSTKAIERGQYKDVNTVGASCIIAVINELGTAQDIPYVFGGDGASFAIPPDLLIPVAKALDGTREMAKNQFNLDLRIGIVPVNDLKSSKKSLRAAKYRLSPNIDIAMFSGGGLGFADNLIKKHEDRYDITNYYKDRGVSDFGGLECRWNPVRTKKGDMLTLIVTSQNENDSGAYKDLLAKLAEIYGDNSHRPNQEEDMSLSFNPKRYRQEFRIQTHGANALKRAQYASKLVFETILGSALFKFDLKAKGVEGKKYIQDLVANTDFQKFDDALRMVIDSAPEQTKRLKEFLEEEYKNNKLYYGLHVTNEALITCLIFNRADAHLHFIDGASGGYALAASHMKKQIAEKQ